MDVSFAVQAQWNEKVKREGGPRGAVLQVGTNKWGIEVNEGQMAWQ